MRYLAASRVAWAVLFFFLLADSGFAQVGLKVNEAGVRLQVHSDSTVVDLLVENRSGENVSGHVLLELVDPRGIVQSHANQDASLPPGPTSLKIALPPAAAQGEKPKWRDLLWYRLRYTITSRTPSELKGTPLFGILSVGEASPGIFELHVAGPAFIMRQSRVALLYFGFWPRSWSLCRLLPVPAATGIIPTLSLQICPRMPGPLPRRSHRVLLPVSSSVSSAFPRHSLGRLPVGIRERDFSAG